MPNGGRKGDNEISWFMDGLCDGREVYLGDPVDALVCEIYRITGNEFAAGIGPHDNKDKIDPVVLEAALREMLNQLKRESD